MSRALKYAPSAKFYGPGGCTLLFCSYLLPILLKISRYCISYYRTTNYTPFTDCIYFCCKECDRIGRYSLLPFMRRVYLHHEISKSSIRFAKESLAEHGNKYKMRCHDFTNRRVVRGLFIYYFNIQERFFFLNFRPHFRIFGEPHPTNRVSLQWRW